MEFYYFLAVPKNMSQVQMFVIFGWIRYCAGVCQARPVTRTHLTGLIHKPANKGNRALGVPHHK